MHPFNEAYTTVTFGKAVRLNANAMKIFLKNKKKETIVVAVNPNKVNKFDGSLILYCTRLKHQFTQQGLQASIFIYIY